LIILRLKASQSLGIDLYPPMSRWTFNLLIYKPPIFFSLCVMKSKLWTSLLYTRPCLNISVFLSVTFLCMQRVQPFDKRYQYLLFAAEPYETISFKVNNCSSLLFIMFWASSTYILSCGNSLFCTC
jgi:hypothetical protein